MEEKEPIIVIKSNYNYLYEFISRNGVTTVILIILLVAVWKTSILPYYLIMLGIYLLFLIGSTIFNIFNYKSKEASFYQEKMIYTDNFFKRNSKTIQYSDVKEIRYNQLFFQIPFGLGTIMISTNSGKFFDNGVRIYGVKNVKEEYEKVSKLVEEQTKQKD